MKKNRRRFWRQFGRADLDFVDDKSQPAIDRARYDVVHTLPKRASLGRTTV